MEKLGHPLLEQSLENIAQSLPNFKSRASQRQMMREVFHTLSRCINAQPTDPEPIKRQGEAILVIEGPTGTGKSLGYLLPAIIAAKALGKHLIVSSATVMLQEQLANKDLPFLAQYAGLNISYTIAKGRGRYACPVKLNEQVMQTMQTDLVGQSDTLQAGSKLSLSELLTLKNLAHRWTNKSWNGDRDSLAENIADPLWSRITNDRHGCLKKDCPEFKNCPFYEARDKLDQVSVIIVNHDLLLSDLAMGGGVILPKPADSFYCIDEAHHLSDKAIERFSAAHSIFGTLAWLEKLAGTISKAETLLQQYGATQRAQQSIEIIQNNLKNLAPALSGLFKPVTPGALYRCPNGILPQGFSIFSEQLVPALRSLLSILETLQEDLKRQKNKQVDKSREPLLERVTVDLGFFMGRVENVYAVWRLFNIPPAANEPPIAKWITVEVIHHNQMEFTLNASPVRAAQLLSTRFWSRAAGVVLTSATLRSLNSFEQLLTETGLRYYPQTTCIALPSPFNFSQQGELFIPKLQSDPSNADAHTREISALFPSLIDLGKNEGTLVLFSSKKQMVEVAENLPAELQQQVLMQTTKPRDVLIREHFTRIANNQASVLFGLASFAEGLDLPGKACTHLIIAKLPFSMPDDPVGQTLAEWVEQRGGNAFLEITLPQASIRLIQAVGRLIRSETDHGRVTILDTRLHSKSYGRKLLQSLPAFRITDVFKKYFGPENGIDLKIPTSQKPHEPLDLIAK